MSENIRKNICSECGCVAEDLFEVDGQFYCADCLEHLGYEHCYRCGAWEKRDDMGIFEGDYVCQSCIENLSLEQCDRCGEYHRSRDLIPVYHGWRRSDEYICDACLEAGLENDNVFHCDDCGDYYGDDIEQYTVRGGDTVCESCRNYHWVYCDGCDELVHEDDATWSEEDDCWYCDDCYRSRARRNGIHDYGYKPYPEFHSVPGESIDEALTFGYELEVDRGHDRYDCARAIDDEFGDDVLYMKNDGSVDFEIVTHPHTLRAYLEDFDFNRLCDIPLSYGYKSHDAGTCGFHIHVGRRQLGVNSILRNQVIQRIVLLMYRHWPSLVKFSRRTDAQLDHWAKAPVLRFKPDLIQYSDGELASLLDNQYMNNYDRYRALNLCNDSTIEFRLWRGSLKPVTLKATLQLTSNICKFAMTHSMEEVVKSTWVDVCGIETCDALTEYLNENGLVEGLEPREIPYMNETRIVRNENSFPDGTRVVIVKSNSLVHDRMVGARGVVVARRITDDEEEQIALRVEPESLHTDIRLHNCGGLVSDGRGYWVNPECIAVYTGTDSISDEDGQDITIGDRVQLDLHSYNYDPNGFYGEVICIDRSDDRNPLVGVALETYSGGHNLDGRLPGRFNPCCGWWVYPRNLRVVNF